MIRVDGADPAERDRIDPPRRIDRSSPWPALIALSLAVAEVGVLFGVIAVGIGGVLLFDWSCAALLHEAGVGSRWRAALAIGAVLVAAGGAGWAVLLPAYTVSAGVRSIAADPLAFRAAMVCGAAGILIAVGLAGTFWSARVSDRSG